MSEAKRIKDMKAAGYSVADAGRLQVGATLHCPDGAKYDFTESLFDLFPTDKQAFHAELKQRAWDKAWELYQQQKRYAELEARLAKVEKELENLRGDGK
jgi:hypothetical protein